MTRPSLGGGRSAAARLDAAIDAILEGGTAPIPAEQLDIQELLPTARLLHEALPRFHPRFGFEARLATRLRGADADADVDVVPFPGVPPIEPTPTATPRRRNLIAGGAIASGLSLALPLAGAALVAWRRSRPTGGI